MTGSSRSGGRVFLRSASETPPVAVRAEGSTIWDADGRAYLDAAGGAIVVNVGHGRRSVADVMASQAVRIAYAHLTGRYEAGAMTLLVSRGTGTWGPPMRLFRRGEITRVKLRSVP